MYTTEIQERIFKTSRRTIAQSSKNTSSTNAYVVILPPYLPIYQLGTDEEMNKML